MLHLIMNKIKNYEQNLNDTSGKVNNIIKISHFYNNVPCTRVFEFDRAGRWMF
jgi:hypothetical protein